MTYTQYDLERLAAEIEALEQNIEHLNSKESIIDEAEEICVTSEFDIEMSLKLMDKRYNSEFYNWIKNEESLDNMPILKNIIFEYEPQQIATCLNFIFQEWNIDQISRSLIELFYKSIDNQLLMNVVRCMCNKKSVDEIVELLASLVIGESAEYSARFVKTVIQEKDDFTIFQIIYNLRVRGNWVDTYFESFIINYVIHNMSTLDKIAKRFELQQKFNVNTSVSTDEIVRSILMEEYTISSVQSLVKNPETLPILLSKYTFPRVQVSEWEDNNFNMFISGNSSPVSSTSPKNMTFDFQ